MTDIVERLRAWPVLADPGNDPHRLTDEDVLLYLEAADEIERLTAALDHAEIERLLKECSDELADQIEGHYAQTKDHPAMKRRYDRDMQPVLDAREALGKKVVGPQDPQS